MIITDDKGAHVTQRAMATQWPRGLRSPAHAGFLKGRLNKEIMNIYTSAF